MEEADEDIAVVGIGCSFPGGEGLDNFWKVLVEGRNCAVEIPDERFDSSYWYDADASKPGKTQTTKAALIDGFNEFDHKFFGITEAEADYMDPQHKLLLQCTYRALGGQRDQNRGLYRDYEALLNNSPTKITHYNGTGAAMSVAANRISYTFNFTGPSFAIDSACSSSLVALHTACQAIRQGDCEMAVCGGVSCILEPKTFVVLSKAKMISPEGTSKPFSSRADGYGRGEGCGVVILKPLKQVLGLDNVWGIISKTAVNQDGRSVTPITKPSMVQQEDLLSRIYSTVDLSNVQYIEAHGTGTPVGDPVEAGSISNIIAKARPPGSETLCIGSVKSNIGHTESAAGVAGHIKVLLMMKHETIVPSVFYSRNSASIDAKALNLKIPIKAEQWGNTGAVGRVAGINNFGFGGTNAHAIVKQHKQSQAPRSEVRKSHQYFVLSAASEKSIEMMTVDTAEQISTENPVDLQTLVYTSACRRSHLKRKYRKVFLTSSLTDLKEQLTSPLNKKIVPTKPDPRLVFVFCGNGVTYQGMCRQLLKEEPVFRNKVRDVEAFFQRYKSMSIIEELESELNESGDFSKPDIAQPILFAIQVAIGNLLKHWGIRPDAILGHSVGEVAAAHCSGLLSLEDAVKVIYFRSILQSKVTGGKMLVVSNMAVSDILKILPSYSGKVCLAAYNSPQSCTLSGDADAIVSMHQQLSNTVNSKNLFLHVLDVPAAYHSHMMDPILSQVEETIGSLQDNYMVTELYSTVSGKIYSHRDFCTGTYWARNIREPVLFDQAVKSAAKDKKNVVFVEIGPKRALQRNIMEILGNDTTVLCSVQPGKDHETMLNVVSKLFEMGVNVDWDQFYQGFEAPPTPFPRYQFDSVKKPVNFEAFQKGIVSNHPVLSQTGNTDFTCVLSSDSLFYLHDHKNNGVAIIPGALFVELGLASFMASAKPKVPLSTQLSINFQNPFILTQKHPEMKVKLEPAGNETKFKIHSKTVTFASGSIECKKGKLLEEQIISLECAYKRCTSVVSSDELYESLDMGGFQYGSVFRNKGDVHYGEEFREALSSVTVPEELVSQLHEFCIHPVILDRLLQLTLITVAQKSLVRPSFPSAIGSLTVFEPLQEEMVIYVKATVVGLDHFEVCGCFTDKEGKVLVELKHVMVKYLGSRYRVVEEYFYHQDFSVISEDINSSHACTALVFADQLGVSKALQQHLNPKSRHISFSHTKALLSHGFAALLSTLHISDIKKNFEEVLFIWGDGELSTHEAEEVLETMANCCEIFRQIVAELKAMHFPNSIRVITYRSAETTVDHVSPGFVLSGMTRACAAEIADLSFQLIDISSASTEDIEALARVLNSYPCSKYPELVVKDGQIHKPDLVRTPTLTTDRAERSVRSSWSEPFILQTADPYRMTSLSAIPSDELVDHILDRSVEVQLSKICVHSSDYFPVSVSDLNFGQTMYWNKHTSQNHKLLALDFSGTVTAVGKYVSKLKVGDHIVSCYPVAASSKIVAPEAVCNKTQNLPFLKEVPCVSYFALAWEILHRALPKVKQQRQLGIFSSVPDSGLLKVLNLTAKKSGWNVIVGTELSGLQNMTKCDALVLLPPYDPSLPTEGYKCNTSGVRHVVAVCENHFPPSLPENIFRKGNDDVHIQTIEMSSILAKGSLRAQWPHIYKWLKAMHLDRKPLDLPNATFQRVTSGSIDVLPVKECESYFSCRTMSVVVLVSNDDAKRPLSDIPLQSKPNNLFKKNAVYIVTGGLSGLGFETVRFIAQRGGGNIVIVSRRSPTPEMQQEISNIKSQCGVAIVSMQCDVSISVNVEKAITAVGQSFPACPIRGVFHSAVVLHDGLIESLDKSLYEKVMRPKVNGVLNLHHATNQCKLDYFVCYSSISSFIGNAYQSNYAAANSFLDTFCHYRRNLGLVGQSINWGALDLGLLLNKDHMQRLLEANGLMVLEVTEIIQSLEQCLLLNKPQQVVCKFSFKNMRRHALSQNTSLTMRLAAIVEEQMRQVKMPDSRFEQTTSLSSPSEYVRSVLSQTIDVKKDELSDDTSLMLAMTLQNLIFEERGVNVPLVKLLDPNSTLSTLSAILNEYGGGSNQEDNQSTTLSHDGDATFDSTTL